jgi:hypothetical protein
MSSQPPRSENTPPVVDWERCERRINKFLSGEFRDHLRDALTERGPISAEEFDRAFDDAVIVASLRATRVGWGFGVSRERVQAILDQNAGKPPALVQEYDGVVRSVGGESVVMEFEVGDDLVVRSFRRSDLAGAETVQVDDVVHVTTVMRWATLENRPPSDEETAWLKQAELEERRLRGETGADSP